MTAPVFGSGKTPVGHQKESDFTYEEVHNAKDFSELLNNQ